ncbi:hypothetical protein NC652_004868 [Populus alba x Populus x berolinensis]|nr:hypothetical protein NC652_004868 [Populus alba x Populus x berolinensis]
MAAWGLKPPLGSRMGCDELYRSDLADRQKLDRDGRVPFENCSCCDAAKWLTSSPPNWFAGHRSRQYRKRMKVLCSRRLALTVLIGAAALGSKVAPADAAYGESGKTYIC